MEDVINPDETFYKLELLSSVACEQWEKRRQEKLQQQISAERQRQEELVQRKRQRQQQAKYSQRSLMKNQEIKKMKKHEYFSPAPQHRAPPHWLLPFIHSKRSSDQPVFLFSKVLTKSDVDKQQARLLLNYHAVERMATQLNDNEMRLVRENQLKVIVLDRQGRVHSMEYKQYASDAHRFISSWTKLYESLSLMPWVHCVHLWSFRVEVHAEDEEEVHVVKKKKNKSQFWLAIESTLA